MINDSDLQKSIDLLAQYKKENQSPFAKQFTETDMIEFAEWLVANCNPIAPNKNQWHFRGDGIVMFTTSELLDIFLNKDNKHGES